MVVDSLCEGVCYSICNGVFDCVSDDVCVMLHVMDGWCGCVCDCE